MMSKIRYYLTFLGMLLISSMAFAADDTDKLSFLNPPLTDKSISYLAQLFGTVGTVLHGTSGELLAKVFEIFNLGVLVIATVFTVYTIFKSVLNTAQDGEFMGKQTKPAWTAIRTCLGVGFLAPVFGGYSAIQVLMMWVVIHGVGFADAAWAKALTYMRQGGQVYKAPQDDQTYNMLDNSAYILKSQICMYESKRMAEKKNAEIKESMQKNPGTLSAQKLENGVYTPDFYDKNNPNVFSFPGGIGDKYKNDGCGSVKVETGVQYDWRVEWLNLGPELKNITPTFTGVASSKADCDSLRNQSIKLNQEVLAKVAKVSNLILPDLFVKEEQIGKIYQACIDRVGNQEASAREGVIQMALDLSPVAQQMVYTDKIANLSNFTDEDALQNPVIAALVGAAADFVNITMQQRASAVGEKNQKTIDNYYKESIAAGWITAGALFYDLGKLQRTLDDDAKKLFTKGPEQPASNDDFKNKLSFTSEDITQHASSLIKNVATYLSKSKDAVRAMEKMNNLDKATSDINLETGEMGPLGLLWGDMIKNMARGWRGNIENKDNGNPILAMQRLGNTNLDVAVGIYMVSIIATPILSVAGIIIPFMPAIPNLFTNLLIILLPIMIGICGSMFATGAVMAIYVPMIPYLLFVFGAIGWVITVFEAMVAAPLIALGITHPEGHDLLGKSEQALMLMLGVFLRPILMVIGMLGGIVLSFVAMRMINMGFSVLSNGVLFGTGKAFAGLTGIAIVIILEIIYCSIVIAVINQAYSLIYHVPDKVMRWIGAPELGGGRPEALGEVKSSTGEAGKEAGGALGKFSNKSGKKLTQKLKGHLSKEDTDIS